MSLDKYLKNPKNGLSLGEPVIYSIKEVISLI